MPTTEPTRVFHRSLLTVLNKKNETVLSQLTRSLRRQMLYFVPCKTTEVNTYFIDHVLRLLVAFAITINNINNT